ncbi:serine/threonine/tyrosine-interacting-like protein 1 isoform X2 [Ctenopharyngodon idella]|uniref:serine/threonine/tyrosine-interacting-like protein 1 isoform X2 n=1 Tax=Ctenopharyngodon idella TaxID=7959 RepID=UPI0022307764|nr:serine/threonine/tyrosine-interacting-like protein 1 isoform X2 [Ctenopharyngodon idella]
MAGKVLCEATKLYNILNQYTRLPRLAESNYLCLIGPAIDCADCLEKASRFPVQILTGGYEKFSALYPFLRTQKILYNIRELESLNPYPVEILPGQLYMGDYRQATNPQILKDLKLNALVNVSDECSLMFKKANCTVLHVRIADSPEANLATSFERMCVFIGSHINTASSVLIFSTLGRSRCCAVAMAYLMHHLKYTLKEAWNHIQQCKANMRPNRGFVEQLSDWELQTVRTRVTDISEPNY